MATAPLSSAQGSYRGLDRMLSAATMEILASPLVAPGPLGVRTPFPRLGPYPTVLAKEYTIPQTGEIPIARIKDESLNRS